MNAPFQYGTFSTREIFVYRVEDKAQLKNYLSSHINVILQNKVIVEMKGGGMVFIDPIYRLWFVREYE